MEYNPKKFTIEQRVEPDEEQNKPLGQSGSAEPKYSINPAARKLYCREVEIYWDVDPHSFVNGD